MSIEKIALERVEIAGTGFAGAEGIVVDREGGIVAGGADGVIRRLGPDGRVTELAQIRHRALGLAYDRSGDLFVCDGGGDGVLRVTARGEVSVFADQIADVRLVATNFPVFDAEGNLYVSNSSDFPMSDSEKFMSELREPVGKGSVVRIRPDGRGDVVARGMFFANGLALDPHGEA